MFLCTTGDRCLSQSNPLHASGCFHRPSFFIRNHWGAFLLSAPSLPFPLTPIVAMTVVRWTPSSSCRPASLPKWRSVDLEYSRCALSSSCCPASLIKFPSVDLLFSRCMDARPSFRFTKAVLLPQETSSSSQLRLISSVMMESCQLSTCAAGKLLAKASDPHFPLSVLRLRGGSGDALGESLEEDEFTDIPKQEEEHHLEDISQPLLFDPMIINMDNLALRSLFPSPFQPQVVQAPLSSPLFHQFTIYLYNAILFCERDKLAVPQDLLDAIAANAILACRYGLTAIGCFGQRLYSRCQQQKKNTI